jgi:predicted anti-sigma-YlaC factor YlaD
MIGATVGCCASVKTMPAPKPARHADSTIDLNIQVSCINTRGRNRGHDAGNTVKASNPRSPS